MRLGVRWPWVLSFRLQAPFFDLGATTSEGTILAAAQITRRQRINAPGRHGAGSTVVDRPDHFAWAIALRTKSSAGVVGNGTVTEALSKQHHHPAPRIAEPRGVTCRSWRTYFGRRGRSKVTYAHP